MNRRDEQIATLKERAQRLQEQPSRLEECYAAVLQAYKTNSDVERLAQVFPVEDRTPSGFRVLTNSEARRIREFNDGSYYWNLYCEELGRSIALGELAYIFEELDGTPAQRTIDARQPDFGELVNAIDDLVSHRKAPDVVCAPLALFVPFGMDRSVATAWDDIGEYLVMPGRPRLRIIWSNGIAPLSQFVIFNSAAAAWRVKLDPSTGERLTVAIGEPESPPNAVTFLAETVAKFEIIDPSAFRAVSIGGAPLDPEEYVR